MATVDKQKNPSKAVSITRMALAIAGGAVGFCFVILFGFLDSTGTHFRAGGTLGGFGESANEHVDSSVLMTHGQQFYWILAIIAAILGSIITYTIVSLVQSKIASRKHS